MHGRPARGESLFLGVWQFWVEGNSGYQHFPLSFSQATFGVIFKRHNYLTPDLWKRDWVHQSLYQELTGHLVKTHTWVSIQRIQTSAVTTREAFYTRKMKCVKSALKMMLLPWEALLWHPHLHFFHLSFSALTLPHSHLHWVKRGNIMTREMEGTHQFSHCHSDDRVSITFWL